MAEIAVTSSQLEFTFDEIMTETPEEFYSGYVSLKYAQAWAMIHFFMRGAGRRYRPTLVQYVNALRRGGHLSQLGQPPLDLFGPIHVRQQVVLPHRLPRHAEGGEQDGRCGPGAVDAVGAVEGHRPAGRMCAGGRLLSTECRREPRHRDRR